MNSETPDTPQTGAHIIAQAVKTLPGGPGVYRMLDPSGQALYVGKARSLKKRVVAYTRPDKLGPRLARMISQVAQVEITETTTEAEALLLEANLIKKLKPRYNILLRDDKSFPYIRLETDHDFPRITKHRGARKPGAEYFGPFASTGAVNATIDTLQRAFLLRPCTDNIFANRTRPCLEHQIKRCSAPCVNKVNRDDYARLIDEARDFLTGKSRRIQEDLTRRMETASEAMDYEQAATLRDRIRALTRIQQEGRIHIPGLEEADVIALAREGDQCCAQVFFFRAGQNFGNRAFFFRAENDVPDHTVIATFIGQFYQRHQAPALILTSHTAEEPTLLEEALSQKEGHRVHLQTPQRGPKCEAITLATTNAREALARRMTESASMKQILQELAETFSLAKPPQRIEIYDNSHIMGQQAVGGMVVAGPEGFEKRAYRKFNFDEGITPGDDYGMMRAMFGRRFRYLATQNEKTSKESTKEHAMTDRPDLVLIDGGAGQLSAAMQVMAELNLTDIPLVAIAKGPDRNAGRERFFLPGQEPFSLPPGSALLHYLQRLRDEAHRFAIGAHRGRRDKTIQASPLDGIPGIGARRKRDLLRHFGSAREVESASLEELIRVPGLSNTLAETVYRYFRD